MKVRVLISGANGLLGQYLLKGRSQESEILGIVRSKYSQDFHDSCETFTMDLTQFPEVTEVLSSYAPSIIIHTAAEGRVDTVQHRMDEFIKLNVELPSLLSKYARDTGAQMVHISSNAVFGGRATSYSDYSEFDPINDYGALKVEAEKSVMQVNPRALVVRPILMYGWPSPSGRSNPVSSWISNLREGRTIHVVNDVWTEPLAVWDCAAAIWRAIDQMMIGPLNVSGGVEISLFDFALTVASVFNLDASLVEPASSRDFPSLAPRPTRTSFDLKRLREELGVHPVGPLEGLKLLKLDEFRATR